MEEKILCPWCGAEMAMKTVHHDVPGIIYARGAKKREQRWNAWTSCTNDDCGADGPIVAELESEQEAIDAAIAAALRRYTPEDKKGLYGKYIITRADGTPVNDRCFVLKPDKDPAAAKALQAYAAATDDEQLRDDLYAWVGKPSLKPMTWEEVKSASECAWIEDKKFDYASGYRSSDGVRGWAKVLQEDYGKTWRCWSRKPTDEERSAAEWETSKQE